MIAKYVQRRPSASCVRSRNVNARPAKYTPAGAISPKPTGTKPNVVIAQFAAKMVAMYAMSGQYLKITDMELDGRPLPVTCRLQEATRGG